MYPFASDVNSDNVDAEKTQPDDDGMDQVNVTRLFPIASRCDHNVQQLNFDFRYQHKTETEPMETTTTGGFTAAERD